ncbi:MAG: 50S ribosomal protein L28 [Candidatus Hydrogenedentes bacterium]|nr:50S ribosomal protein L28 [Candidatus Hydrogenedentota bacterium]
MARVCEYSGKRPQVGNRVVRRGKSKKSGGIGLNVTGISRRRWKPNLQKIRVVDENGRVHTIKVCARYIKAGKFVKSPRGARKAELAALAAKSS